MCVCVCVCVCVCLSLSLSEMLKTVSWMLPKILSRFLRPRVEEASRLSAIISPNPTQTNQTGNGRIVLKISLVETICSPFFWDASEMFLRFFEAGDSFEAPKTRTRRFSRGSRHRTARRQQKMLLIKHLGRESYLIVLIWILCEASRISQLNKLAVFVNLSVLEAAY